MLWQMPSSFPSQVQVSFALTIEIECMKSHVVLSHTNPHNILQPAIMFSNYKASHP
jgi:hypothetical protein